MRLLIFLLFPFVSNAQIIRANPFYIPKPSGVTYLLDAYPNATVAYSFRKLSSSYSGNCLRIRRDSTGNAETDIGFVNDYVDTIAIKNHCRNNSCFVTTLYDQSGGARNATQSTASNQPRIVNSGSLEYLNGKIALNFYSGGQRGFLFTPQYNNGTDIYYTFKSSDTGFIWHYNAGTRYGLYALKGSASSGIYSNYGTPSIYINGIQRTSQTRNTLFNIYNDLYNLTSLINVNNSTWVGNTIWGYYPNIDFVGLWTEYIQYNSTNASNRTGIETNINNYYGLW